jgi:hypothetical protein
MSEISTERDEARAECRRAAKALAQCSEQFVLHEERLGEHKPIDYERIAKELVRRHQIAAAALASLPAWAKPEGDGG